MDIFYSNNNVGKCEIDKISCNLIYLLKYINYQAQQLGLNSDRPVW